MSASSILQLSPEEEVNSGGYQDMKHWGIYLALFTEPEGDSCFSINQITFCKLKKSLGRNFVYNLQTFRGFCWVIFTPFVANSAWK